MTILPTIRIGETLRVRDLEPSSELSSWDSLTTIGSLGGSLGASFGAARALEKVDILGGTDILKAVEQEPPNIGTKANEGVRAWTEGRIDDTEAAAWKTSLATWDRFVGLESI